MNIYRILSYTMKIQTRLIFLLSMLLLAAQADVAEACTNLIVGKKASTDGSVIVSYSADSYGMYGNMYRHVGSKHAPGEMRAIYEWDTNKYLGEIPQAAQTYNVVGQMNEHQVTITETTFGGREELADSTGLIDYGSLIYIGLERSRTAREAIKVMTDLVARYGYYSEGESFTVADKNEAWILEMIGKGPGNKGAVWVAVRIPDDCISAHANQSRITRFDMKDRDNVMFSKDVVDFARSKGYFPKNARKEDFSFRDAYCPLDFGNIRFCDARVWSFFNRNVSGMDKYMPYINGEDMKLEMPLYVKPEKPLSVRDVQNCMRDHYEGTPLDLRNDIGAGAYHMPYRPRPLTIEVDGKQFFNERPISTQQSGFAFVGQMRNFLPDAIGGVVWWTNDDANMTAFTPIYCSATEIPACYVRVVDSQDEITFSWNSAYWVCNLVSNMVYPYYNKMMPDVESARNELENRYAKEQAELEARASALYESAPAQAVSLLTSHGLQSADRMMERWKQLFAFITVKHNDMVVKPEQEGKFLRSKYGYGANVRNIGYDADYWRAIEQQPGRYISK